MIDLFAKWTIILFGLFFICVGFLMLIRPDKAREIVRKAGSTNFINYAEITIGFTQKVRNAADARHRH